MQLTTSLTCEVIAGSDVFDRLGPAWDALVDAMYFPTPFQRRAYQQAWWENLGRGELITVAVRDGDRLVAIAPLMLEDGALQFNASKEETDYLDLIARPEDAAAAWGAVLAAVTAPEFPAWSTLDLWNILDSSPSLPALAQGAAAYGLIHAVEAAEVCPVVALPDSFDAYLEMLDSKERKEMKRKLRRARGAEVKLEQVTDPAALAPAVDDFLTLLESSTFEKGSWLNGRRSAVFHAVAAATLANGMLELLFLTLDGRRVATLFSFDYNGRTWVYNSGLDPTAASSLGLGVILTAQAIERAIERGNTTFDFMRGDEAYKYRFGAQDTHIQRVTLRR